MPEDTRAVTRRSGEKSRIQPLVDKRIEAPRLAYNFSLDVLLNIANALDARAEELLKGDWQASLK